MDTRTYFSPPVHRQQAYRALDPTELPVTDIVVARVLELPIYPDLDLSVVDRIVGLLMEAHRHAGEVGRRETSGTSAATA